MRQIEQQARQAQQAEEHARRLREMPQPSRARHADLRQTPSKREVRRTGRMVWIALCAASLLVLVQRLFFPNSMNPITGLLLMVGAVAVYGIAVGFAEAKSRKGEKP